MAIQLPFKPPQVNLGPRTRKILKYAGYAFFAIFVFLFALQLSFPYSRVKDKLVESASDKYTINVTQIERGFMPGRVYFKGVTITPVKKKPDEVVQPFFIDKLQLDVGVLPLLGGKLVLDFDATIGDRKNGYGHLEGGVSVAKFGKGDITADITGSSLPSFDLPMIALVGLPMEGKLQFHVDLSLPQETTKLGKTTINWQRVTGGISLACPKGCTFGDGKTKLKPLVKNTRQQAMVGDGIEFGPVSVDSLIAKLSLKRGTLKLDKFEAPSKDGEVHVDYEMKLEKSFDESVVTGCLRFKASDDLGRREPKTFSALTTTGAELRGDGLFHIRLTGPFKDMKRLNQECGPNGQVGSGASDGGAGGPTRPNLTVQPDEAAKPTAGSALVAPTAPPPPTPIPETPATPPLHDAGAGSASTTGAAPPPTGSGAHEQPPGTSFEPSTGGHEGRFDGAGAASGSGTGSAAVPPAE